MPQVARPHEPATLSAFLEWEKGQPERWEFINGGVHAMAGGTLASNRLSKNISRAVDALSGGNGCEAFAENVKVVTATDAMYPDVVVACGPLNNEDTAIANPLAVFEVLSKGTSRYDSGAKFLKYQTIPSLRHYVLVSQDTLAVQHFSRRPDGHWADYQALSDADDVLVLGDTGIHMTLKDIYANVLVSVVEREPR